MQKLVTGMRNSEGFTLIEILVVLVIIGITIGFAMIAFGDFGESRKVMFSADQFAHTIRLAQQKAILETSTLGIKVEPNGYQILKYQTNSQWTPISNRGIFKFNYFPKNALISLKSDFKPIHGGPNIVLNTSGEMTPFTLEFKTVRNEPIALLTGSYNGNLDFTSAKTK
jgi:general secretion pathway protein H